MPALKTCARCPALVPRGTTYCPACARTMDLARGDATQRGYTARHRLVFREGVLARDPVCGLCHAAWATVADHYPVSRRDLVESGLDPDDPTHGRGLCAACHNRETARNQPGGWAISQGA